MDEKKLEKLCKLIRYDILTSTTKAGSGHPTSALSAVELLTTLFFSGFYHFDPKNPKNYINDRFILSKGHASPLLYSLYHAGGLIDYKELMTLRKFGSRLEGHPSIKLPYVDVATGSLGQGLSVGIGMALGIRLRIKNNQLKTARVPKVWVLLGDSEMAEGQVWEAAEIASYYKLNNLVGIIDVNRLGQQGETEKGWDIHDYQKKLRAFGWKTMVINNGHNLKEIKKTFDEVENKRTVKDQQPIMAIIRTVKGKGVSFLEDKNGWHGKTLDKNQLKKALKELGEIDLKIRGKIKIPTVGLQVKKEKLNSNENIKDVLKKLETSIRIDGGKTSTASIATREAYGDALVELGGENPNVVVLDAEVANSTYENKFQKRFPDRFFEMFIAEENMMSVALGLSKINYIPFSSTFAAFMTQTFDQIRMAQYSNGNIKIVGSHAGVSIGQDGPSQMGLEDISMMRSILNSIVFYPSDATSTYKLVKIMTENKGLFYLRATRGKTPIIYNDNETFEIGGFKIHECKINSHSKHDSNIKVLIISAGITLHEALNAQKILVKKNIYSTVLDLYCIKPLDNRTIKQLIDKHSRVIVVEDHYPYGGIGEAISPLLVSSDVNYTHLCVRKIPTSGTTEELLRFEEINVEAIIKSVTT